MNCCALAWLVACRYLWTEHRQKQHVPQHVTQQAEQNKQNNRTSKQQRESRRGISVMHCPTTLPVHPIIRTVQCDSLPFPLDDGPCQCRTGRLLPPPPLPRVAAVAVVTLFYVVYSHRHASHFVQIFHFVQSCSSRSVYSFYSFYSFQSSHSTARHPKRWAFDFMPEQPSGVAMF